MNVFRVWRQERQQVRSTDTLNTTKRRHSDMRIEAASLLFVLPNPLVTTN